MEDRSIIKPILNALEYFYNSPEEINYFYHIIDRFCAYWFNKNIKITHLDNIEYILLHDLLGEYIRFEESNKRVALWLLSINRVCYNYTNDLAHAKEDIMKMEKAKNLEIDSSLIEPILKQLKVLDKLHRAAGKADTGQSDIISNFLQWVMVYTTYIYPSLENKLDFYESTIVKAMHFVLMEFIKQRSNDKRMAYLVMAIIEACKQYSLKSNDMKSEIPAPKDVDPEIVIAGKEEQFVEEILNKLKYENIKQRENPVLVQEISAEQYVKDNYDKFIDELNNDVNEAVPMFNNYTFTFANALLTFDKEKQISFFQTLFRYRAKSSGVLKPEVLEALKNSIKLLSQKIQDWFKLELENLNNLKDQYISHVIKKINSESSTGKFNSAKLFIMLYIIKKFELF